MPDVRLLSILDLNGHERFPKATHLCAEKICARRDRIETKYSLRITLGFVPLCGTARSIQPNNCIWNIGICDVDGLTSKTARSLAVQ
jgi:hypothetical protein